jgi:hypothetical protein
MNVYVTLTPSLLGNQKFHSYWRNTFRRRGLGNGFFFFYLKYKKKKKKRKKKKKKEKERKREEEIGMFSKAAT